MREPQAQRHTLVVLHTGDRVILASASPRRKELLARLVPDFEIIAADIDEDALTGADPIDSAIRIARAKAEKIGSDNQDALVIAADTIVFTKDGGTFRQLGKPADAVEAREMLRHLSGREHTVVTGVCLMRGRELRSFAETTDVQFRALHESEINEYVATGEPLDKAGAYAIQGGAAAFVESYSGSLSNVIGLPMEALETNLGLGQNQ